MRRARKPTKRKKNEAIRAATSRVHAGPQRWPPLRHPAPKPQATRSVGISAVGCAGARQLPNAAELDSAAEAGAAVPTSTSAPEHLEQKPAASGSAAEVREKITAMIRQNLPEQTKAYNEA